MDIRMRIGIDGAQSSGKTTLWTQLKGLYVTDFVFIPEAARQVAPSFGIAAADDWPGLLEDKVQLGAFFSAEEEWQRKQERCDRFISDSSLYLIQAYRHAFGLPVNDAALQQARYDLLLHCGLRIPLGEDGFRFLTHRNEVDRAYRQLIASHFAGVLVELEVEQRFEQAVAAINAKIHELGGHVG